MKRAAFALASVLAASSAHSQDLPFTIQIVEDPRTARAIQSVPLKNPATLEMRYATEAPEPRLTAHAWRTGGGTEFRAWSNYALFVDRAEIIVMENGRAIGAIPIRLGDRVRVETAFSDDATFHLRAYDARGRMDQTREKEFRSAGQGAPSRGELLFHATGNDLGAQRIRLSGRAITADGAGIETGQAVDFEGYGIPVRADGRFEATQIVPAGDRVMDLAVLDGDGRILTRYSQPVSVADEDFFYVGIADLTVGRNDVSGPIKEITQDDSSRFDNEVYLNGRLAFYLRGKMRGDWNITASADTREGPIEDLFDNFLDSDAESFLRRLDPERYYPVYGDDSTAIMDAPTDGKLYLRLERDGTELLWGNFKTRAPDTYFTNTSRSLYGARARLDQGETPDGEPRLRTEVFAAEPGTVQAQDQFRGTGGSLYFLRNQDILRGSPRVWVETRDATTGALISRTELAEFQDYELNAIQGRIQLATPLGSTGSGGSLLGGATTGGNPQFLVVRYEYSPGIGAADETVFGGSAEVAVRDRLMLGVNGIRQQDGPNEQTLAGVVARYRIGENSTLELEAARSRDAGASVYESLDGGFTFTQRPTGPVGDAAAGRIALSLDFADAGLGAGQADLFLQKREAGFSGPGEQTDEAIVQYGADVRMQVSERTELRFLAEGKDSESQTSNVYEIDIARRLNEATTLSFGVVYDDLETRTTNASNALSSTGRRLDAIVRLDLAGGENWTVYGYAQGTLDRTGSRARNDRIGLGGSYDVSERLGLNGELSGGTGGLAAKAGVTWRIDERTETYLSYSLDPDSIDNTYRGQIGKFTYGGSRQVNDFVQVLAEQTYHHGDGPVGVVNSFGLDLTPDNAWSFGLRAEVGNISDPINGDLDRTAVSFSSAYNLEKVSVSSTLEYRIDEGVSELETWGLRTRLSYQVDDDWRFLASLGAATSDSTDPAVDDTEFVEFTTGLAYRPAENDRLNFLFRYTYLYDSDSSGQVGAGGTAIDFAQRSQVLSADAIYELNNVISLGGKLGVRVGEIRQSGQDWISSDAFLGIVRVDMRLRPKWDLLGEWRHLATPDADSSRDGALFAVYRRINNNFRIGVGYNATDFSDDLTDQSYTSKGIFLNAIGKF